MKNMKKQNTNGKNILGKSLIFFVIAVLLFSAFPETVLAKTGTCKKSALDQYNKEKQECTNKYSPCNGNYKSCTKTCNSLYKGKINNKQRSDCIAKCNSEKKSCVKVYNTKEMKTALTKCNKESYSRYTFNKKLCGNSKTSVVPAVGGSVAAEAAASGLSTATGVGVGVGGAAVGGTVALLAELPLILGVDTCQNCYTQKTAKTTFSQQALEQVKSNLAKTYSLSASSSESEDWREAAARKEIKDLNSRLIPEAKRRLKEAEEEWRKKCSDVKGTPDECDFLKKKTRWA